MKGSRREILLVTCASIKWSLALMKCLIWLEVAAFLNLGEFDIVLFVDGGQVHGLLWCSRKGL